MLHKVCLSQILLSCLLTFPGSVQQYFLLKLPTPSECLTPILNHFIPLVLLFLQRGLKFLSGVVGVI